MPRIYKDGVLYNTAPSTASQLPYDSNTSTKDKIDSKADSSSLATVATTGAYNDLSGKPTVDTTLDDTSNNAIANSTVTTALGNKAPKSDLASISITGNTNNTGSTIYLGTFFYLNGSLVRAITDIGAGATLTLNTNYERFSLGAFNRKGDDVYTLINNVTMTDTVTSYSTYGSRKISDFSYLLFLTGVSINDMRDTKIIPMSKWSSGKEVNGFVLHGSSSSSPADHRISTYTISYDSDTSFKAVVGGSKVITNLFIYGIL